MLYKNPWTTVNAVSSALAVSFANANDIISRLETNGILKEKTGQARNRHFLYQPYVDLFSDL